MAPKLYKQRPKHHQAHINNGDNLGLFNDSARAAVSAIIYNMFLPCLVGLEVVKMLQVIVIVLFLKP